jgi:hypothetical protein
MFVTDDRRAKCILQNVSVLSVRVCVRARACYVGMYLSISVCMCVCVCIYMYVCLCVCTYVCMYLCIYVCVYVCMYFSDSLERSRIKKSYSSLSYNHFQKSVVSILQIYLGFYRCLWFKSLLSYWISILEMFIVLQCSGVKT